MEREGGVDVCVCVVCGGGDVHFCRNHISPNCICPNIRITKIYGMAYISDWNGGSTGDSHRNSKNKNKEGTQRNSSSSSHCCCAVKICDGDDSSGDRGFNSYGHDGGDSVL